MPQEREPPSVELSPMASSISKKLGALKKALQFDAGLKSRLSEAQCSRDLLHYVQDELLAKLAGLHGIGVISQESYEALETFSQRCDAILAKEKASDREEGQLIPQERGLSSVEVYPTALSVPQKLRALKMALQFHAGLKFRLAEVQSPRNLLYYVQDELLPRLASLHEIGLISQESYGVLEAFREKCDSVLAEEETSGREEEPLDAEELYRQVLTLKEKLRDLRAKCVTKGIISEREHALGEDNAHLHKRLQAQRAQLKIARMQLKTLASTQETVKSLRDRNSALRSRVEYQARLLQSMPMESSGDQEVLSTMEKLADENRRLKARFEGLSDLLSQFQSRLPADVRGVVQDLMKKNAGLLAVFEGTGAQLEEAFVKTGKGSGPAFLESIERLHEENTQLKRILQTKHLIAKFIEGEKEGGIGDSAPIVEALSAENQHLERALREREEQLRLMTADPSNKPLLKALQRFRDENAQLLKDNAHKEQVCKQLAAELKESQRRLKDRQLLIRKDQSLKTEMESCREQMEALKKRDSERAALKKEYAETCSRYQALAVQYRKVNEKLAKLGEQHDLLMKEYEKLFMRSN